MYVKCLALLAMTSMTLSLLGQEFLIKPYLQNASPSSITIMWETSSGDQSTVEWGLTEDLENITEGIAFDINYTEARVHEVTINGLQKFTSYYYRVKTGDLVSDMYKFKTPPFGSDNRSFNMIAMSDMQIDGRNPGKFREIINEGVFEYLKQELGEDVPENLALVMIPGDLVGTGSNYTHWHDHFFGPSQPLFAEVPVYPVLGNHEQNSVFYFKYFSLPKNGTPAYDEHWWYKDYSNTRIIGLNSNDGYRTEIQLSWLEDVLEKTAANDSIDFVFVQLHHPHKSELWLDGEIDYTGEVIQKLEAFTEKTGKPSIHFFGHTHGYSRGQSRDHKHLWVNVATAGGRIDEWGAYAQENYDEFSVTESDYGFVMVEVDANQDNPKFTLKRISRGNELNAKDNELNDSITVYKSSAKPEMPQVTYPTKNATVGIRPTFEASDFKSVMTSAFHAGTHWQVSADADFQQLVYDSWKQHEDRFFDRDLQENDDLTDEVIMNLRSENQYFIRVRYRDQFLVWSEWSDTVAFQVK